MVSNKVPPIVERRGQRTERHVICKVPEEDTRLSFRRLKSHAFQFSDLDAFRSVISFLYYVPNQRNPKSAAMTTKFGWQCKFDKKVPEIHFMGYLYDIYIKFLLYIVLQNYIILCIVVWY